MPDLPYVFMAVAGFILWISYRIVRWTMQTNPVSRPIRVMIDSLGGLALLPTLLLLLILVLPDQSGNGSGLAWFMIYSVVTLGLVPLVAVFMIALSARLVMRIARRQLFA
jgi:hypothetical protein